MGQKVEDSTKEPQCPTSPTNTCYWLPDDNICYLCLPHAVMPRTMIHLHKNKNIDSSYSMVTSTYWATSKWLTNQGCSSHVKPCSASAFPWEERLFDVRGFTSYSWKQCWVRICPHANPYPEAYPSKHDSIWTWSPWELIRFPWVREWGPDARVSALIRDTRGTPVSAILLQQLQ